MKNLSQIFLRIGKGLLPVILSFFIGIVVNKITDKSEPYLSVDAVSSTTAGRTVTDIEIENVGDEPLASLKMHVVFSSAIEVSVRPMRFSSCAIVQGADFKLECSSNVVLKASEVLSLRFTSKAEHLIVDDVNAIDETSAVIAQHQVQAKRRSNMFLKSLMKGELLFLALFAVVIALVVALIVLLTLRPRPSGDLQGGDSPAKPKPVP